MTTPTRTRTEQREFCIATSIAVTRDNFPPLAIGADGSHFLYITLGSAPTTAPIIDRLAAHDGAANLIVSEHLGLARIVVFPSYSHQHVKDDAARVNTIAELVDVYATRFGSERSISDLGTTFTTYVPAETSA